MMKALAIIYGIVFVAIGVMGFLPHFTQKGMLVGILQVNVMLNVIHLATGIIALWVGFSTASACRIFFQVFGIIYLLASFLGFYYGDQMMLGMIANNAADSWAHLLIALVTLYFGFGIKTRK